MQPVGGDLNFGFPMSLKGAVKGGFLGKTGVLLSVNSEQDNIIIS